MGGSLTVFKDMSLDRSSGTLLDLSNASIIEQFLPAGKFILAFAELSNEQETS